jgi:plastocyanin
VAGRQNNARKGTVQLTVSRFLAGPTCVGLALLLAACSGGGTSSGANGGATAAPAAITAPVATTAPAATSAGGGSAGQNTVNASDTLKFEPASLTVPKGTTVTWTNTGAVAHTVTFDPAKASDKSHVALPSGAQPFDLANLNGGQSLTHTFDVPGTYKYVCVPHEAAGMTGTVVVSG